MTATLVRFFVSFFFREIFVFMSAVWKLSASFFVIWNVKFSSVIFVLAAGFISYEVLFIIYFSLLYETLSLIPSPIFGDRFIFYEGYYYTIIINIYSRVEQGTKQQAYDPPAFIQLMV